LELRRKPTKARPKFSDQELMEKLNLAILSIRESLAPIMDFVATIAAKMDKPIQYYAYFSGQELEAMFSKQKSGSPSAVVNRIMELVMGKMSTQDPADPGLRNVIRGQLKELFGATIKKSKAKPPVPVPPPTVVTPKKMTEIPTIFGIPPPEPVAFGEPLSEPEPESESEEALSRVFETVEPMPSGGENWTGGTPLRVNMLAPAHFRANVPLLQGGPQWPDRPLVAIKFIMKPHLHALVTDALVDVDTQFSGKWTFDELLANERTRKALACYIVELMQYSADRGYKTQARQVEHIMRLRNFMSVLDTERAGGPIVLPRTASLAQPQVAQLQPPPEFYGNTLRAWNALVAETQTFASQYLPYIPEYARRHQVA